MAEDIKGLKEGEMDLYVMADQFINVANDLVQDGKQEGGRVGAAMRYAVARFNAHEAAIKTPDLAGSREDAIEWFTNQYKEMLTANIDEQIEMAAKKAE